MKIQLPQLGDGQYINTLLGRYAMEQFQASLGREAKNEFEQFLRLFAKHFPLDDERSEDKVVKDLLMLTEAGGWKAHDRRSTFVPGTKLKPDIWLDNRDAYFEAMQLRNRLDVDDWNKHCQKSIGYARTATQQVATCTDGRRWFVVCTLDGELKYATVDLKKVERGGDEFRAIALLVWKKGPLYNEEAREEGRKTTLVGKTVFKNHVLKNASGLDDAYKEYFGLVSACAYAHYNGSRVIATKKLHGVISLLEQEQADAALTLLRDFVSDIAKEDHPGISDIAARVRKVFGKHPDQEIKILRSLLVDSRDHPLSWETFHSDDLSEVYEALMKSRRQELGIYTTPRDLCWEVVREQVSNGLNTKIASQANRIALVDPCCGSGSFLDQAVRYVGQELLADERKNKRHSVKEIAFIGQDVADLAVAISLVNVGVACIRYLLGVQDTKIAISITTGDTADRRSPLYRRLESEDFGYVFVFGNPPYLRSRSAKHGGMTDVGNLLFEITQKAMSICTPGDVAFVLPAHIKGGDASRKFDKVVAKAGLRLTALWHLPEMKIFRGVSERRHLVLFWTNDDRASGKVLVFTPPKDAKSMELGNAVRKSLSTKALQFTAASGSLADIPLFSRMYLPEDVSRALVSLPRLSDFKNERMLTVVQGIQEAHPYVPVSNDGKGRPTKYAAVNKREGYHPGDPVFVLPPSALKAMLSSPPRKITSDEDAHLLPHAKSVPLVDRLEYPLSGDRVIFTDGSTGELDESEFEERFPHFFRWLRQYYELLMEDCDRASGQLRWWQLHRSCDPRPSAAARPGVDFKKPKVLATQFLGGNLWAWADYDGHAAAGSNFSAISTFPGSASKLRANWPSLLAGWLNSYLIRDVWLKLLGHCKLRGVGGEVQIGHLLEMPIPRALFVITDDEKTEACVDKLELLVKRLRAGASDEDLLALDESVWKLFSAVTLLPDMPPQTRRDGPVDLRATA